MPAAPPELRRCCILVYMPTVSLPIQAALLALVVVAAVYDFRYRRIPNWLALIGLGAGLGLNTVLGKWEGLQTAGGGFAVGFGLYFLLYLIRAMGAGDVKLMGAVGSLVGPTEWLKLFAAAAIVGGALGLVMIVAKGRFRQTFWNIGFILSEFAHFRAPYMKRQELDVKSSQAATLPHGVAIALGTVIYLAILWRG